MTNIIICAASGRGKTTLVKNLLHNAKNVWIYDVNNEYVNGYKAEDFEYFKNEALKKTGSFIVFEEGTVFFPQRGCDKNLMNLLIRKRHTKNTIVTIFHSLNRIPMYILEQANYIFLKKTNDRATVVERNYENFPDILSAFYHLQKCSDDKNNPDFYEHELIKIN